MSTGLSSLCRMYYMYCVKHITYDYPIVRHLKDSSSVLPYLVRTDEHCLKFKASFSCYKIMIDCEWQRLSISTTSDNAPLDSGWRPCVLRWYIQLQKLSFRASISSHSLSCSISTTEMADVISCGSFCCPNIKLTNRFMLDLLIAIYSFTYDCKDFLSHLPDYICHVAGTYISSHSENIDKLKPARGARLTIHSNEYHSGSKSIIQKCLRLLKKKINIKYLEDVCWRLY